VSSASPPDDADAGCYSCPPPPPRAVCLRPTTAPFDVCWPPRSLLEAPEDVVWGWAGGACSLPEAAAADVGKKSMLSLGFQTGDPMGRGRDLCMPVGGNNCGQCTNHINVVSRIEIKFTLALALEVVNLVN